MTKVQISLVLATVLFLIKNGHTQQCRQVTSTVCDPVETAKGEKGNVGTPGKVGPIGPKGLKGDIGIIGEKGSQGAACDVEEFQQEVQNKFAEFDLRLTPTSCEASSEYGRQTLRSGQEVFCDGKWTVFQKRFNGSVNFDRNWTEYKHGFGSLDGEFWYGLEKIHQFTKQRGCRVRFDLWDFEGDHAFAEYSDFYVEDEADLYRLHLAGYSGTAGNSMLTTLVGSKYVLDKRPFSTIDRDNDNHPTFHCAENRGGFWYNMCAVAHPNNVWGRSASRYIRWNEWKKTDPLKETIIKMRCD